MIGSKLIAMIAAVVGVVGVSAAGVYLYRQSQEAPPSVQDQVATGTARAPAAEQPKPQALVSPNPQAEPKGAAVPSFDVVRIEPTGEGVIAGRAEPGWQVSVESHGTKVAEATADAEGEWTIVLDKPLPPGDHALSLKAVSPDGTHGLVSQTEVPIAIAKKPGEGTAVAMSEPVVPAPEAGDTTEALPNEAGEKSKPEAEGPKLRGDIGQAGAAKPEASVDATPSQFSAQTPSAALAKPKAKTAEEDAQPEPVSPSEQAQEAPSGKPKQPPVRFKTVDYEDKGEQPGKMVLTGTGDPGARILLFFDNGPLGQVIIGDDGTWQFETLKLLPSGQHVFRADRVDETTGIVVGRASIEIKRQEPAPEAAKAEPSQAPEPAPPAKTAEEGGEPKAASPTEQAQEAPSGKPKQPQVLFKTVDYEDKGDQPGKMVLTGTGDPGARLLLFFDDVPLGEVIIGGDGTWRFEIVKLLPFGRHAFRAGRVDETTGLVGGTASIGVQRMEPAPKVAEPEQAPSSPAAPSSQAAAPEAARPSSEAKPSPGPSSPATSPQAASPQVAAAETGKPAAAEAARPVRHKKHKPGVYTVRRGDSLWAIAERFFGGGWHYVTIYHQNRKDIRNPRLIYPQQKVHLPKP